MARNRNSKRYSNKNSKNGSDKDNRNPKSEMNAKAGTPDDKKEFKDPDVSKDGSNKESSDELNKRSKYNDPSWYTRFSALAFGSGNLPYAEPMGAIFKFWDYLVCRNVYADNSTQWHAVPGVGTLKVKPSYGLATNRNDPLNVAAQLFYTNVRAVNSGRKNYDPCDLMLYCLAIADIYAFVVWCERIYGYAFMYSQRNYYVGQSLMESQGVSHNSITTNLANFRYWINAYINKVASYAIPGDIALFARRIFMFSGLYTESNTGNIKDQLYQFAPDGFFKFALDTEGRGMLQYEKWEHNSVSLAEFSDIMVYGESLLTDIFGDEDFALMSGDILKAYGSNIVSIPSLPEEVMVLPQYEEYILSQFKNANIVSGVARGTTSDKAFYINVEDNPMAYHGGNIYQDNKGNLISLEYLSHDEEFSVATATMNKLLSVTNPNPSIDDNFEASRLMVGFIPFEEMPENLTWGGNPPVAGAGFVICGSEIATDFVYAVKDSDLFGHFKYTNVLASVYNKINLTTALIWASAGFKWSPMLYLMSIGSDHNLTDGELISNVDNVTQLSQSNVTRLHETALLSLFYVPGIAKVVE